MEFVCKKTIELSEIELLQISQLFERVFEKPRSVELLLNQYVHNILGYSFHSMMMDEGRIVALNTYVPAFYVYRGKKLLFANSTDSMVEKKYRDLFNFMEIVERAYDFLKKEGFVFVYGYPNENSYPVLTKSKLMKNIGKMNVYCLPYRISFVSAKLKFFNFFSALFSHLYVLGSALFSNTKSYEFIVKKDDESYNLTRYKRWDGQYNIEELDGVKFMYKLQLFNDVRTLFLIDVEKKTSKNFNAILRFLIKNHSKDFDLLLYPGVLPFKVTSMIKIPQKISPKNFYFTGKCLNKKEVDDDVWNINNWDTNLSNYDLI